MKQIKAEISENKEVVPGFYKMRVVSAYLARDTKPGQFFEVRCSDGNEPLLRRPFSVHRILKDSVEILYEIVGSGTETLARKKAGGLLDLIGPLGNGFSYRSTVHSPQSTVLVGGGIGVAPLVALAEEIVHGPRSTVHGKKKKIHVLIGAKTKSHILCEKDFKRLGCDVSISTEDGTKGRKGFVTNMLKSLLSTVDCGPWTIYTCGPATMLKAVAEIAAKKRIPCQVSLEERMACGVGVCLGCPVRVNQLASLPVSQLEPANRQTGRPADYIYKMVCKDGPVFNAEEIAW